MPEGVHCTYIIQRPARGRQSASSRTGSAGAGVPSSIWRTWASTIRSRAACVGRPDAALLRHGPVSAMRGVLAAIKGKMDYPLPPSASRPSRRPLAGPDLGRLGDAGACD